ncbi:MAG: cobyrinate a,c-diamide synthase [Candidatus Thermoplasmatota archaeon]|jgi:cobyrinic acid a,c-diamide synthase|nr:cobyrinate a,c-diamide synthase [Candidatus Thermoplasmatota archaeon]MCL5785195.1 cobyrinate a,c-diamide synthase [Candidatus Thermoplasmatota archaeon]
MQVGFAMKVVGITAPSTGSGKTTVTMGLLGGLHNAVSVKIGPDYIDPAITASLTRGKGVNIDRWIQGRSYLGVLPGLARQYDFAVLEGVMGMFDSGGHKYQSTDYYFRRFRVPYVLVLNVEVMAESAFYQAKGFITGLCLGVVLNNYGSARHLEMVSKPFTDHKVRILGAIPKDPSLTLESRHLGLKNDIDPGKVERIAGKVSRYLDFSFVDNLPDIKPDSAPGRKAATGKKFRFAVALDDAFSFYYWSSIDFLGRNGEIQYFSPLKDEVPEDPDFVLIGGGYPEIHAKQLSSSHRTAQFLKSFSEEGKPILAECGGLMYLEKAIVVDGNSYPMCGVFDGTTEMTGRLTLSYTKLEATSGTFLYGNGSILYGHEYHYSSTSDNGTKTLVNSMGRGIDGRDGLYRKRTLATYSHFDLSRYGKKLIRSLE